MPRTNSLTVSEALQKIQRYCAYQERCHQEVRQKLREMRMIPEAIDHIMVALIKDDYLNESRFAQAFVRGKFRIKKWGRKRLISELKAKGISKRNIDEAISEISEDEYTEMFHSLAEKKALTLKEANKLKRKRKLADYLLYRGWESQMVYAKVNELIS